MLDNYSSTTFIILLGNSRMNTPFMSLCSNNAKARHSIPSLLSSRTNQQTHLIHCHGWSQYSDYVLTMCPCHFTFFSHASSSVEHPTEQVSDKPQLLVVAAVQFPQSNGWRRVSRPSTRIGCNAEFHPNMWVLTCILASPFTPSLSVKGTLWISLLHHEKQLLERRMCTQFQWNLTKPSTVWKESAMASRKQTFILITLGWALSYTEIRIFAFSSLNFRWNHDCKYFSFCSSIINLLLYHRKQCCSTFKLVNHPTKWMVVVVWSWLTGTKI